MMAGVLSATEVDPLASHIEACSTCVALLQTLSSRKLLPDTIGGGVLKEIPEIPAWLEGLMTDLRRLPQPGVHTCTGIQPPERLGSYRILRLLGEGGMGSVYLAEDERLGRTVALKTIRPAMVAKGTLRDRFWREAQAVAALRSDHIVPIYQVGEDNGVAFLVMPLLKGESLEGRLRRANGSLPVAEAVRIAREIALGLAAAHAVGLIHRDIKPGNIWLEETADETHALRTRVRLLDFGLVRRAQDDTQLTSAEVVLGTPCYMAPEQARAELVDPRADLFSLGCVFYHMLTGQRPFVGRNLMSVLTSLAVDTPSPPHELNPDCPRSLSNLVLCLLAKKPSQRPPSATAVARSLLKWEASPEAPGSPVQRPACARYVLRVMVGALILLLLSAGLLFRSAIYHIVTDQGELVIETDASAIEVKIVQQGLVIHDRTARRDFILKAGKGEIEVYEKDGIKVATRQFELTRNGKTTVKVTLGELSEARKRNDPERRAAEWVLSVGGKVRINDQSDDIDHPCRLPKEGFRLTHVNVYAGNEKVNERVTDEGMATLEGCKHLAFLNLGYTHISNQGVAHIKDCQKLTVLTLARSRVTDEVLGHFKDCKHLTLLNLDRTKVGDLGIASFKDCKDLRVLHVAGTRIGDKGLATFAECEDLTVLWLGGTRVTDEGLACFKKCRKLESLYLGSTSIGDEGMAHLKDCQHLHTLYLHNTHVTDATLAQLKERVNLRYLYLHGTQVSDSGLVHLKGCKQLNYLNLGQTKVTQKGIDALRHALPECKISMGLD